MPMLKPEAVKEFQMMIDPFATWKKAANARTKERAGAAKQVQMER